MAEYDRVVIDENEGTLSIYVNIARDYINTGSADRIVDSPPIAEVFKTDSGRLEVNGGGVPKNSKLPAQTSRFGVAWWTDPQGRKHIRVVGDRIDVNQKYVGSVFGQSSPGRSDFFCVYPKGNLEGTKTIFVCACGRKVESTDLEEWDGMSCRVCRYIKLYEEETGFRPGW